MRLSAENSQKLFFVPQHYEIAEHEKGLSLFDFSCQYAKKLVNSEDLVETQVATALSTGEFNEIDQEVGTLSGGWQKKLMICLADTADPDLVLYDEPTNHLDIRSTIWLEKKLRTSPSAWVCVSHDRYFLQKTCNRTLEINKIYKSNHFTLPLPYLDFVEKRFEYFQSEKTRIDSLKSKLRKENEWLSRQPKARTTKSKSRIDSALAMQSELSEIKNRLNDTKTKIDFQSSGRQTKSLISVLDLEKIYGSNRVINNLNFEVNKGLRLGLLGDNGSGKSTLLKLFAGHTTPTNGIVKHADDLRLTFFEQSRNTIPPDWSLKRALSEEGEHVSFRGRQVHVTSWAAKFRFSPSQLDCLISDLSGGELARVYIAKLMLQKADVLILDEPTNDLDIQTLDLLEENLEHFSGSIIVVSHDRHFLSNLCNHFLALDGNGNVTPYASYEQWEKNLDRSEVKKREKAPQGKKKPSSQTKKLSYMAQREFDAMEENILKTENELEELQAEASNPRNATNAKLLAELGDKISKANSELERMYIRWGELENQKFGE